MGSLLKCDICLTRRSLLISSCFVALCTFVLLFAGYCRAVTFQVPIRQMSFADNVMVVFAGCSPFEFRPGIPFVPPLGWLLLFVAAAYGSLDYSAKSLTGFGSHILVEGCSRVNWLKAKFLWVLYVDLVVLSVAMLSTLIWTAAFNQDISFYAHRNLLVYLSVADDGLSYGEVNILTFCLSAAISFVSLSFVQLTIELIFNPAVALISTTMQLVAAAYYETPLLFANLLMSARWSEMSRDSVPFNTSLSFGIFAAIVAIAIAFKFISNVDIIDRGMR